MPQALLDVPESRTHLVFVAANGRPIETAAVVLIDHRGDRFETAVITEGPVDPHIQKFLNALDEAHAFGHRYGLEVFTTTWLQRKISSMAQSARCSITAIDAVSYNHLPTANDDEAWTLINSRALEIALRREIEQMTLSSIFDEQAM